MSGRRIFRPAFALLAILLLISSPALAQEKKAKKAASEAKPLSVEALAEKAKPSIVVILHTGRQGKQAGLGTGFVIDADGLIATNYHVIGDGRPITVQLPDGAKHEVTEIHASDRHLDLAVVRIAAKGLDPLPLGDSDAVKEGQAIIALGHPQGLKYSVVAGVLSGRRDVEGMAMMQIAMPIEQGNSGGPVLDMFGKVVGIVTMKSLVTANLGFAVPTKNLQTLLKRPNPVPMSRWVTLGRLDPAEWQSEYGGNWRQRAGRLIVDGVGTGFGGRSLCFNKRETPKNIPYEVAVTVKLDDEKGAAGLIFGGEGRDEHFGFYPSGGKLRFTNFAGPDVFAWKILHDAPNAAYRPGDWNTLKVRVEKDRMICFVNDREVVEQKGLKAYGAAVGLAKFRETSAEFKKFQVAASIDGPVATPKVIAQIQADIDVRAKSPASAVAPESPLLKAPGDGMRLLRERALQLEKQAEQLRQVAQLVHQGRVLDELRSVTGGDEAKVDLFRGALLIAKLDNEELETETYVREIDRLARDIAASVPKDADEERKLEALNKALFKDRGFHGSRHDYYARNNSYINEVIDDREGLPITLSVLYMELARRLQLNVVGVALPGHFVVRYEPKDLPPYIIDVFEGGTTITNQEAMERFVKATGQLPKRKDLLAASKKTILVRMLHNLINVAEGEKDRGAMLRYLDAIVTIDPKAHDERFARAVLRMQLGQIEDALRDCDSLLENASENEIDIDRVHELKRLLENRARKN
jgi:serine protease Do